MKIKIYLAQAMTGHSCRKIRTKADNATKVLEKMGFEVWSPSVVEGVPYSNKMLDVLSKEDLLSKWMIDKKEGMQSCHVILDIDGDIKSEGVSIERGYMRWFAWRPTIRIKSPGHIYSISNIEDDFIASSTKQAGIFIKKKWGTRRKWVVWKLEHIIFGIPKLIWLQIRSLWL